MKAIILFDGDCAFCNRSVQFILKRDRLAYFSFASLQSKIGQELMLKYKIPADVDSLVLIEKERYFLRSTAALNICKKLSGFWPILTVLKLVPTPIRDFFYNFFAKRRLRWFGKQQVCFLPSSEDKKRFLE